MRPRGEVRMALGMAAAELGAEPGGGATWRTLAHRACVGLDVARRTVVDMARAGELIVIGHAREPGVCRPMNIYAPTPTADADDAPGLGLGDVVRCWADFR